jgi:hypothetical protein
MLWVRQGQTGRVCRTYPSGMLIYPEYLCIGVGKVNLQMPFARCIHAYLKEVFLYTGFHSTFVIREGT